MEPAAIMLWKDRLHLPLTNDEIAEVAYQIERVDLGIKEGTQDQYAATYGGFNFDLHSLWTWEVR